MTCLARVKSAAVCKELDEESGIELGQVDLRVCLETIINARSRIPAFVLADFCSPELKKEEWSVYVLDPSEDKFSGNGTITSVINDDEPTHVVGKVKRKFKNEILQIELRLVKVNNALVLQVLIKGSDIACEKTTNIILRAFLSISLTTTAATSSIAEYTNPLLTNSATSTIPDFIYLAHASTDPSTKHSTSFSLSIHRPIAHRL